MARRERPHLGAKLTPLEIEDGYRYGLWLTNLPARPEGWRASLAYIDAAHAPHNLARGRASHLQRPDAEAEIAD